MLQQVSIEVPPTPLRVATTKCTAHLTDRPEIIRHVVEAKIGDENIIARSYKHVDGTSFAAPIVSAVVAQMLEANPALTPQQVKRILMETAERLPGEPVERQGSGAVVPAHAVAYALSLRGELVKIGHKEAQK